MVTGKNDPRKIGPGKMVPGKLVPEKLEKSPESSKNRKIVGWESSIVACWDVINLWKPKTRQQTQKSEINPKHGNKPKTRKQKIVGWASSIVVCVWNVRMWSIYENPKLDNKHKTRKQKSWGERRASWCVYVEYSDVINLWKPKTRQEIFLDSFSVLQFGAYVGSWRNRQTSFLCVVESINKNEKIV